LANIFEIIKNAIIEAFLHNWIAFPILIFLYIFLEWYGHLKGFDFSPKLRNNKILSPMFGSLIGLIPQCGIGVLMTGLYLRGAISTGTIISIYIATSDEALPVIFSNLSHSHYVFIILIIKFVSASIIGIMIDFIFPNIKPILRHNDKPSLSINIEPHHSAGKHKWSPIKFRVIIWHASKHAGTIFIYILVFSTALFIINSFYGIDNFIISLEKNELIEISMVALIGLIPNCVASVAIAEGFLHYSLSFGAMIGGLSSAAGVGLILLIKEAAFSTYSKIIGILIIAALMLGLLINRIYYFRLIPDYPNKNIERQIEDHYDHHHGHNH
jgi:hypothetical protein